MVLQGQQGYLHTLSIEAGLLDQPCHGFCKVPAFILPTSELKPWCLMIKTELQARRTGHW